MPKTNFAPWSAETAEGIKTDPVDSNIRVKQEVIPAITVGTINSITGEWNGVIASDTAFLIDPIHEAVGNGATVLSPQRSNHEYIDMTGFSNLFFAIKPSNGGACAIDAVMGPSTYPFANLTPVNAAASLRGNRDPLSTSITLANLFTDSAETLTADVWNIFVIEGALQNQKLLQFKITNNSGGPSNIQFASLRVV
jgi:hypothetical protein